MALKIYWTKKALNNFDNILEFLVEKFGTTTARNFAIRVHNFVDNLQYFPELGNIQNSEKQIRGFVIVKQVCIFYRINKDQITILNLFDNRQDPSKSERGIIE